MEQGTIPVYERQELENKVAAEQQVETLIISEPHPSCQDSLLERAYI